MDFKLRFFNFIPFLFMLASSCSSFKTELLFDGYSTKGSHSRGIAIDQDHIVVSGPRGTYSVHDLNGQLLSCDTVPEIDDFRDVAIMADSEYVFLNSSLSGKIIYVEGHSLTKQSYLRDDVFLDGMDFWDAKNGIAYGDPYRGRFFLLKTNNGGQSWMYQNGHGMPQLLKNEAGFAASGTGIDCIGDSTVFFGSGMCVMPRLYASHNAGNNWVAHDTPMKGGESFGIYSLFFWSETEGIIIGGSYLEKEVCDSICFYTPDGGLTWSDRSFGLPGYCSSVQGTPDGKLLIATGTQGTVYSLDKGLSWKILTSQGYNACAIGASNFALCGKDGIFAVYQFRLK